MILLERLGLLREEAKNNFDREKLSAYCVAIANEGAAIWCSEPPTARLGQLSVALVIVGVA